LIVRLGLRANEVATLRLDDIDWQTGCLTVRAKGRQRAQLPLPQAVGEAIASYLRCGRPRSASRRVFLRHNAPCVGFLKAGAIGALVLRALKRAGVASESKGAHLLRHSLATQMLRTGASLTEIGQVLRHRRLDTTRIYAKVDLKALRAIALAWPGGVA
jgi:site-specific recombinase XerD